MQLHDISVFIMMNCMYVFMWQNNLLCVKILKNKEAFNDKSIVFDCINGFQII